MNNFSGASLWFRFLKIYSGLDDTLRKRLWAQVKTRLERQISLDFQSPIKEELQREFE